MKKYLLLGIMLPTGQPTRMFPSECLSTGRSSTTSNHVPAMLRGIQCQEMHAGKNPWQGVEVRGEAGGELAPGGEEEHHGALGPVGVQELHQVLQHITSKQGLTSADMTA